MKKGDMILGLDLSTSASGWAVVDFDEQLHAYGCWRTDTKRFVSVYDKLSFVCMELRLLEGLSGITGIYIEKPNVGFKPGLSSASTIAKLSGFNTAISYKCFEIFGIEPAHIMASSARKTAGIKVPKGTEAKVQTFDQITLQYPQVVVQYVGGNGVNAGKPNKYAYDVTDAIVVALSGVKLECQKT